MISNDSVHTKFFQRTAEGMPVDLDDVIDNHAKLSEEDIKNPPEWWKLAPIIVSTNPKHLCVTEDQAIRFAKENNTCIFKWRVRKKG